ncbi:MULTISPECIES: hypothetical protein [Ensifer]|jgi:hypothetical protein|uniref:hypothetical protein n=1 Tax=unclassified Ensifer TaxID=2633371 RepID=UPI0007611600|nr:MULTISPECIES: hypothetical protein [Ensifer]UTV40750.1 hypothetical protein MYG64_33730 [Ensifer adhaerens]
MPNGSIEYEPVVGSSLLYEAQVLKPEFCENAHGLMVFRPNEGDDLIDRHCLERAVNDGRRRLCRHTTAGGCG